MTRSYDAAMTDAYPDDLTEDDWAVIAAALDALATDPREPERYRERFAQVLAKVRKPLTDAIQQVNDESDAIRNAVP